MGASESVVASVRLVVVIALALGSAPACSGDEQQRSSIRTETDLKGAALVALAKLPRSPENGKLDDYCKDYRAEKLSAVGRQVAKLGWIVTSEEPLGKYSVVTFASGFDTGTSGMCAARNANIGIFEGRRLVALAYTTRSSGITLGVTEPMESGGLLIEGGGWMGPPVAELRVEQGTLRLTHTSAEQTFCGRQAIVPVAYGRPIDVARQTLLSRGWRPMKPDEPADERDGTLELARRGVTEANGCSPTGLGYCTFRYSGAAGVLHVGTIGGPDKPDNSVVSYGVMCRAGPKR